MTRSIISSTLFNFYATQLALLSPILLTCPIIFIQINLDSSYPFLLRCPTLCQWLHYLLMSTKVVIQSLSIFGLYLSLLFWLIPWAQITYGTKIDTNKIFISSYTINLDILFLHINGSINARLRRWVSKFYH